MYAVKNIEQFIHENPELIGTRGDVILARAKQYGENGVVTSGAIEAIFDGDWLLACTFRKTFESSVAYQADAIAAIQAAFPGHPVEPSPELEKRSDDPL